LPPRQLPSSETRRGAPHLHGKSDPGKIPFGASHRGLAPPPTHAAAVYGKTMTNNSDDLANKLIMQGVHIELTAAMQNAIRDKFSVLLRHNEWIVRVQVRLQQDQKRGTRHHYSATGQIEMRGPDIVATVKGDDAYNVLDGLVEKLDEQLRERHERRKDKRNHPNDVELDAPLPKQRSD
jgi:putative sigma-54 modulation protein